MSVNKDFLNCFYEFIFQRRCIVDGWVKENPEYQKLSEEAEKLYNEISALLGSEKNNLILSYDDAKTDQQVIESDHAYLLGFKDGVRLRKHIHQMIAGNEDMLDLYLAEREPTTEVEFCLAPLFLEEREEASA